MNKLLIISFISVLTTSLLASCSDDAEPQYKDAKSTPMTFRVSHPAQTRATSSDFEAGDCIEPQHIYFVLRPISQMCCYTDTYKLQKGKDKSKNRTKIKN